MEYIIPSFNERISDHSPNIPQPGDAHNKEFINEMREITKLEDEGLLPIDEVAISCRKMSAAKSKQNRKDKARRRDQ